jgi:hypothetical protein
MIGYSTPNMSQMRVCSADLAFFAAFVGVGVSTLFTRTGGLLLRLAVFGVALAFASGAVDLRVFAGPFVVRLALALGRVDLRFFAGAFVLLF